MSTSILKLISYLSIIFIATEVKCKSEWSYKDTAAWGEDFPQCKGQQQSPINLEDSISSYLPLLMLINYRNILPNPLPLENNGHSVSMEIPTFADGSRSYFILDSIFDNKMFEAMSLHFHWGAPGIRGSEHAIENTHFDGELHIVHKNRKYKTMEEATQQRDGLAVLGFMLNRVMMTKSRYDGLNEILNKVPQLIASDSKSYIYRPLSLSNFFDDMKTRNFYTYSGSLTTPPCAEAVTWFVFPTPLDVESWQLDKFWNLLDHEKTPLVNNFRPLQYAGNRTIIYRHDPLFDIGMNKLN